MLEGIHSPAQSTYWIVSGRLLFAIIPLLGMACFAFILLKRIAPLLRGAPDFRLTQMWARLTRVLKFWLVQWKQPVSYTHLDVYKRQPPSTMSATITPDGISTDIPRASSCDQKSRVGMPSYMHVTSPTFWSKSGGNTLRRKSGRTRTSLSLMTK